jgi:hypothetical protein
VSPPFYMGTMRLSVAGDKLRDLPLQISENGEAGSPDLVQKKDALGMSLPREGVDAGQELGPPQKAGSGKAVRRGRRTF